jgi:hypothetical protein
VLCIGVRVINCVYVTIFYAVITTNVVIYSYRLCVRCLKAEADLTEAKSNNSDNGNSKTNMSFVVTVS